jgi:hypothetical protein
LKNKPQALYILQLCPGNLKTNYDCPGKLFSKKNQQLTEQQGPVILAKFHNFDVWHKILKGLKRLYTVVICTYFISSAIPVTTIRTE